VLDNKGHIRTLPCVRYRTYYERREARTPEGFTPDRADARRVHHLPLVEYGDEHSDTSVSERRMELSHRLTPRVIIATVSPFGAPRETAELSNLHFEGFRTHEVIGVYLRYHRMPGGLLAYFMRSSRA